jgi:LysR family transcriptional regulator, benzoate and cis,cis-muconate-responsive activator of ben and cat genes
VELRHLRAFVAVAQHGSVSGAAGRLHLTQPSLSEQIGALERHVGRAGARCSPGSAAAEAWP